MLPPKPAHQPGEDDDGAKGDHHIEHLGQEFGLGRKHMPAQQVEPALVVELDKQRFLDRLEDPKARNHQEEVTEHEEGERQLFSVNVKPGLLGTLLPHSQPFMS